MNLGDSIAVSRGHPIKFYYKILIFYLFRGKVTKKGTVILFNYKMSRDSLKYP